MPALLDLLNLEVVVLLLHLHQTYADVFPRVTEQIALGSAFHGLLGIVRSGVAHQGIAMADVEVDVGQRLNLVPRLKQCHQLEEQTQLGNFGGLFLDVHAVEVVDDDVFDDRVILRAV